METTTHTQVLVTKANGQKEFFNPHKLERSLIKAGASIQVIPEIIEHIKSELKTGISTHDIYHHAFFLLHKMEKPAAIRYSLKKAVMDLGPSGFPFESFVAEIFKDRGYSVRTDQVVPGFCVDHEVDVVAWDKKKLIMVEAKFHNMAELKSDIKVVLYVKSRFDDLKKASFLIDGQKRFLDEGWLVTNTKFSEMAVKYGSCQNMKMIGWNYPATGNLHDLIEDSDVHPITCLSSLTKSEKELLLKKGVVLCKRVFESPAILKEVGLHQDQIDTVLHEIKLL